MPAIDSNSGFQLNDTSPGVLWSDGTNVYEPGTTVSLADGVTLTPVRGTVSEQLNLMTGITYYFDLSGEGIPGVVNTELPDTSLKWVPFTYAGTVNAYSQPSTSRDFSLFVADYNVSHTVSWDSLNTLGFISGKSYESQNVNYRLHVPTGGIAGDGLKSDSTAWIKGTPLTNEWDQVLNKDEGYIKNGVRSSDDINAPLNASVAQETVSSMGPTNRTTRGGYKVRDWNRTVQDVASPDVGFRPFLEVLNPETLGEDGLKTVVFNMDGQGTLGNKTLTSATVVYHDNIRIPEVTEANGFHFTGTGSGTLGWYDGVVNKFYTPGQNVSLPPNTILVPFYGTPPTIAGPTEMTLPKGYALSMTTPFTVNSGILPYTLSKVSGIEELRWDAGMQKFFIDPGLQGGKYSATIKASNGVQPDTTHTFTLSITEPPGVNGTQSLHLVEGYPAQSTTPYTITGYPEPTVTKISGNANLTWNAANHTVDIAAGLAAGDYSVELKASNGMEPDEAFTFTLKVTAPPVITTDSIPDAQINTAYSYALQATGKQPIAWSITEGSLPNGLAMNQNGILSGTPSARGTFSFTVKAMDDYGVDTTRAFTLKVNAPPELSGLSEWTLIAGYAATSVGPFNVEGTPMPTITKDSGHDLITWNSSTNKLDIAAGLPAGEYLVTLKASNGILPDRTMSFTLKVNAPPGISGPEELELVEGYAATSTEAYTLTGMPVPTVTKVAGDGNIQWNNSEKKLDIAAGLAPGDYAVTLKASNGISPEATLTFTLKVRVDPDIAIVAAAKTAAEGASYSSMTQAVAASESAIESALKAAAEAEVNNSAVIVTVNKVVYTAPVAGNADDPNGIDGSYAFTITVVKGLRSQTSTQKTIAITATPFTGLTHAQAVAAAKTVLKDSVVDVVYGATQADKVAAVQGYVNSLLIGDAAGVTAMVTYNSGTDQYDVVLSKGSASDSKSLNITVNETADPDIAIVAAAKTVVEKAAYPATTQAVYGDEAAVKGYVEHLAFVAVNNNDVTVTVNKVSYTAPIAGTSANRSGTDGSFVFTVTVAKGTQSQTTGPFQVRISATAYSSGSPSNGGGGPSGGSPSSGSPSNGGPSNGGPSSSGPSSGGPTGGSTTDGSTPGNGPTDSNSSGGGTSSGSTFADVGKEDWFADAVAYVQQNGLMLGTSETNFSPQSTANRAMIATILYHMAGSPRVTGANSFTDVPSGMWYTDAIKWTAQNGIVSGHGNNRYGTDQAVTREQLAAILYRYAQLNHMDVSVTGDLSDFADKDNISNWATDAMKWAVGKGLFSGKRKGELDPLGTATRAEIAVLLMRFMKS
ncbi:Endo-1,4-beta-xylanase A precursor [compost metagenome]